MGCKKGFLMILSYDHKIIRINQHPTRKLIGYLNKKMNFKIKFQTIFKFLNKQLIFEIAIKIMFDFLKV